MTKLYSDDEIAASVARIRADIMPHFRRPSSSRAWGSWRISDAYADDIRTGAAMLQREIAFAGVEPVIPFVQRAIATTTKAIWYLDDSNGVIGDAIFGLLDLHAQLCEIDPPPAAKLVKWLVERRLGDEVDPFYPDLARYADALGEPGLARIQKELDKAAASLSRPFTSVPESLDFDDDERWVRFRLLLAYQRLAVAERDEEAIVTSCGGDHPEAYRRVEAAKALRDAGFVDRAIECAHEGTHLGSGFQTDACARLWCELLAEHRPAELVAARREVFDHRPKPDAAAAYRDALGADWPSVRAEVLARLEPADRVGFLLYSEKKAAEAWDASADLAVSVQLRADLVAAYQRIDPAAVLPSLRELVEVKLEVSDASNYRDAARLLRTLVDLSDGLGRGDEARAYVVQLRDEHRRRPRLQREFDRERL